MLSNYHNTTLSLSKRLKDLVWYVLRVQQAKWGMYDKRWCWLLYIHERASLTSAGLQRGYD